MDLKQHIVSMLADKVDAVGFAPVNRFDEAPEAHHPSHICKEARTVIVFGRAVPRGMLHSPDYSGYIMHRAYHSAYPYLDEIALTLSNRIEDQGRYLAVPVPSYAPMVFQGREPWGILSLKHAAVNAGLGSFGRNGLMHSPRFGTLLRLGAVITSAELPGDPMNTQSPCPDKCSACVKACPNKAFLDDGTFQKMTCLAKTIKHAIYPLAFQTPEGLKQIERVVNTAGYNYWLDCHRCLKVCPNNHGDSSDEAAKDLM
ncbi:MAG: 4Fe-4S double cluster binding domain-containing protein [Thermodesulfobacteriota bacterium]